MCVIQICIIPKRVVILKNISNLHLDYLVEIYQVSHIETNGAVEFVSSAELSQRMFATQSSVNRIIDRLNTLGLVEYQPYVGVKLNQQGQELAVELLRKQAMIESFLMHTLKFEWHQVYEEASQLRHHVSNAVLNRMWKIAGQPKRSPFGEWIEAPPNGQSNSRLLIDGELKQHYVIDRILTRQSDRLQYLSALGLIPGTRLQLLHKAPFDGPIQIHLDREYRILAHDLSQMMTILPTD